MTDQLQIDSFLESQGYKLIDTPSISYKNITWYQKSSDNYDLPLCETNDKQPSFFLKHHKFEHNGIKHESFEIELVAEHHFWWVVRVYSVSFQELRTNINFIENKLANGWKTLCKKQKVTPNSYTP